MRILKIAGLGGMAVALTMPFATLGHAQTDVQKELEGTEIRFLQPSMPQFAALGRFIDEFEEEFGITVIVDQVPFDQYRQKSLVEMQQGTGAYDIYAVDVMWLAEYAAAGFLQPIMDYVKNPDLTAEGYDIDDFLPRIISGSGVYDETLYTIPIGAAPTGTTFRKDVAEEAGIDLPERFDPKFTTDFMYDAAAKVNNPETGMIGFANMPGRWFWGVTYLPYLYAFQTPETKGDEYVDEEWKITIDNERTIDSINYFTSFKEFMPADSANWGIGEATAVYQAGNAFGTWSYTEFINGFFEDPETQPEIAGKNVHLHTPAGPHGVIDPWFGAWTLGISRDSKNKEAAWTFIQWITSPEIQERATEFGAPPVRHSTYKSETLAEHQPWWTDVYEYMLNTTNPDERIRVPEWAEISDIMGEEGNRVWIGEIDAETAAANMQRRMTQVMRRGGYYIPGRENPPQHWRDLTYYDRLPSEWN
ncbi:extracellular solute-binding protein [Amorphus orientalis]|uniref:Multiple sugar transport system substrate-binding protein n=1 Tax=Amorphus orientalis TaxID=649198 RepID=A0AAE3VPS0_9HYPH|nr:extracellular solute-binding protein [Amorphus orientalis]MDQ0315905.1 multiple sugar transport system substrate-binding protein [Amorphus orientalis]